MGTFWIDWVIIVLATSALCGWWLAVRPNASYRGVSGSVSVLIVLMAALASALAMSAQVQ